MIGSWKRRAASRRPRGAGLAMGGTAVLHAVVAAALVGLPHRRPDPPPFYRVNLVAAPAPQPEARRAPEAVDRPAERAVSTARQQPRRTSVAPTPPPPADPQVRREPAPRTTPTETPRDAASTGSDVATIRTEGLEFPFPEYLRNMENQIYRRWNRPSGNQPLRAEVQFLIHRDGTISGLRFIERSGNFAFDLEAQGAIEAAATAGAFGPLPEGYGADILPVNFFFDPRRR